MENKISENAINETLFLSTFENLLEFAGQDKAPSGAVFGILTAQSDCVFFNV